ncbi:hypothetical protein DL93DRAFT_1836865 [Clavulina sp. PMI_390]|nr:hypothetical protein DL93DRAFT_1836865 [Clavulina sp. PMI_390]
MKSTLDSALSVLQNARSAMADVPLQETLFDHVLRTTPSDRPTRRRHLQATMTEMDETINCVRAMHEVVASMLDTLRRKRADLHHALLSPTHSLPIELLQRVFSMVVGEAGRSDVVLPLTHVCSSWRLAALGSGHLWENIDLLKASSLSELAARSAPHPFSLELRLPLTWGLQQAPPNSQMIQFKLSDSSRLKHLSLSDASILSRLKFPNKSPFPNLESLSLEAGLIFDPNSLPPLPTALNSVVKLTIRHWDRPRCQMNNAQWPRLTSLYFKNSSVTSVMQVLDGIMAPHLSTLLFTQMMDGSWTGSNHIMGMPPRNIREIVVVDSSRFLDSFMGTLRFFPNLTSIVLARLGDASRYRWPALVSFESCPMIPDTERPTLLLTSASSLPVFSWSHCPM